MRFFLSRLARAARKRLIILHAFSLLPTHFHLLVESVEGELAYAMQVALGQYVRRFNRLRRRDGPLFSRRYWSRLVATDLYRRTLTHYIDENAVSAGLASKPVDYPFCSAHMLAMTRPPRWLSRRWTCGRMGVQRRSARELTEQRLRHRGEAVDPIESLVSAAPSQIKDWMARKASLADGTKPGLPIVSVTDVLNECSLVRCHERTRNKLEVGLLFFGAGQTQLEIARRLGCAHSTVQHRLNGYRRSMATDRSFSTTAAEALERSLRRLVRAISR